MRWLLGVFIFVLVGCSTSNSTNSYQDDAHIKKNPFDLNSETSTDKEILGGYGFGPSNVSLDGSALTYIYEGEEIALDFYIECREMPTKAGFLLFVDGMPQPYKIKSFLDDYDYLYEFNLQAGDRKEFQFLFTPITGKKGEQLEINVAGIFYPSFIPEDEYTSYGNYHKILPIFPIQLAFNEDTNFPLEDKVINSNLIKGINQSVEMMSSTLRKEYEREGSENRLDKEVFIQLYENKLKDNKDFINIYNKESIHLNLKSFGKDGAKYRTILYLNHQPIKIYEQEYIDIQIEKGNISNIDIELDVGDLEGFHTLYSISIPLNDTKLDLIKTNSILLNGWDIESQSHLNNMDRQGVVKYLGHNEIDGIYYGGENKMIIDSNNLYLIEGISQEKLAQVQAIKFDLKASYYVIENGYCGIGGIINNKDIIYKAFFYDGELNLLEELNLTEVLGLNTIAPAMAIAHSGEKIAFFEKNGLFLYNRITKTKELVLEINQNTLEKNKGLIYISDLVFTNDDKSIVYIGQSLEHMVDNEESQLSIGIVDVDGNNLLNYRVPYTRINNIGVSDTFVTFSESLYPFGTGESTGKVILIEEKSKEIIEHVLLDKRESQNLFLSDEGKYFATSIENKPQSLIVRIYETKTGQLIKEFEQKFSEPLAKNFRKAEIKIFDEVKSCVVFSLFYGENPLIHSFDF